MDRKPKTIFQLDSPYTTVQWPQIQSHDQNTILELLCSMLSSIGRYRCNHGPASKGKRSKKRKRQEVKLAGETSFQVLRRPSSPEISPFIIIGLNSITRLLELSSRKAKPQASVGPNSGGTKDSGKVFEAPPTLGKTEVLSLGDKNHAAGDSHRQTDGHFSAIFVLRSSQPSILHAHLPQLIATASLAYPELPATRLVQLPIASDARLCGALGLPRVSFIGMLDGAPHSKTLVDLVRDCVPELYVPWLQESQMPKYMPVKINAVETFAPSLRKDQK